jgi:hypothetical protein
VAIKIGRITDTKKNVKITDTIKSKKITEMKKDVITTDMTGRLGRGPMTGQPEMETGRAGTSAKIKKSSSTNIIRIDFERGTARRVCSKRTMAAFPPVKQKCGKKGNRFPER